MIKLKIANQNTATKLLCVGCKNWWNWNLYALQTKGSAISDAYRANSYNSCTSIRCRRKCLFDWFLKWEKGKRSFPPRKHQRGWGERTHSHFPPRKTPNKQKKGLNPQTQEPPRRTGRRPPGMCLHSPRWSPHPPWQCGLLWPKITSKMALPNISKITSVPKALNFRVLKTFQACYECGLMLDI